MPRQSALLDALKTFLDLVVFIVTHRSFVDAHPFDGALYLRPHPGFHCYF
jgi:hypothetical protein